MRARLRRPDHPQKRRSDPLRADLDRVHGFRKQQRPGNAPLRISLSGNPLLLHQQTHAGAAGPSLPTPARRQHGHPPLGTPPRRGRGFFRFRAGHLGIQLRPSAAYGCRIRLFGRTDEGDADRLFHSGLRGQLSAKIYVRRTTPDSRLRPQRPCRGRIRGPGTAQCVQRPRIRIRPRPDRPRRQFESDLRQL